ncbi:FIST signal transduction protein [Methylomonas koyamae]|uniref:FIST signal transduction protein n=1 Tax=Methylomonas koyamae TaxID=702114 RepID=UPI001129ACBC|nr:FIST C-terminal domain-containing protein [Methylomonas koyamae]TPQ25604.1 histidine kinase [Methylomonas koyamae]
MAPASFAYFPSIELAAIESRLAEWRALFPEMGVLALFPEAEKASIPALQALCNRGGLPLCGAMFPQLIYGTGFRSSGVCLLRFDRMPYAALFDVARQDAIGAAEAAETIAGHVGRYLEDQVPATLFLVLDALLPNIGSLLDELYLRLANRVHYAGVNAGSETFQAMPCLFDNQRIIGNGVLALLLKPHDGAVLEHGYRSEAETLPATSTDRNRIIHIDWRPAFEVYQELVRAKFGVEITRDKFYQYAVHFPFGILRANHTTVVRIPVMLDADNALYCIGEVPPHSMLALLDAPQVDSPDTLQSLHGGLSKLSGAPAGRELLLFYCAGRRQHLGAASAGEELAIFQNLSQASAIAGGLALGEIGDTTLWGYPLFHNATVVTAAWTNPA